MVQHTLVVLGGGGVGKSSVTVQFVHGRFEEAYDPTVENSYHREVTVDRKKITLDIVDTAGQEDYVMLRDQYMTTGEGFLLVYDITQAQSLKELQSIQVKIGRVKGIEDLHSIPMVLIGNKCDLDQHREVSTEEGKAAAARVGAAFFETSAKKNINVEEAFIALTQAVLKRGGKKGCLLM